MNTSRARTKRLQHEAAGLVAVMRVCSFIAADDGGVSGHRPCEGNTPMAQAVL